VLVSLCVPQSWLGEDTVGSPRRPAEIVAEIVQVLLNQALLNQALLNQALLNQALLNQALLNQALEIPARRTARRC
jgi:hypothetical protein